jgi:pimeloyl-ACP methyl ester carboxylesterase
VLHLAHANGFPPETYRCLAEPLRGQFSVVSMAGRPLWDRRPPSVLTAWDLLADDLAHGLRARRFEGVVGVGHSLGAVITLLAAAASPGLFAAVVLIDPVLLTGWSTLLWRVMTGLGLRRLLPISRGARRRRDRWPSRQAVHDSWSGARVFSGWDRHALDDYIDCGVVDADGGGVELAYPKAWEARVFETAPASVWHVLTSLDMPILLIQGEQTDPFLRPASRRARTVLGPDRVVIVPGTSHLVPMERPREVARRIVDFALAEDLAG